MTTIRLDFAYDGSGFAGYARQDGHRTVQAELETTLTQVLRESISTSVGGRTDAGVHARGQVVSFQYDGQVEVDEQRLKRSIEGLIGPEIAITGVTFADDDFSARFSASWRQYRYLMNAGVDHDPQTRAFAWHVGPNLNFTAMRSIAEFYVGRHDFSAFCRSVEGKSNVRQVAEANLLERDGYYEFWIRGNAFCHQMVRSLVGHMYDVGRGYSDGALISEVFQNRDRSAVVTVAPPHGLTLWEVGY